VPRVQARVAVVSEPERLELEARSLADPGPGEALVRVRECGICGSDLKMYSGTHPVIPLPLVPGHEFYGTVEAVGAGAGDVETGALVSVFPTVGCGHCFNCRRGLPHLCPEMELIGGQRQGGLAERVVVPAANLLPLDPDVPEHARVLVEPLAVGVHAARRARVERDERVVIVGAGPIGIFTALALRHGGVEGVLLADLSDERLALARRLGAGDTVNSAELALGDHVRAEIRPEGVDVAFDCVGQDATAREALALTAKGGRAVLVGLMPAEMRVDGVALQRGERALVGVQMYVREDFRTAMRILAGGAVPAADGVLRSYALEDAGEAFRALKAGRAGAIKSVVAM
jgi:2-desacetyl-2-hydroxyethyl bacteriochlorophyllide A dehydrogenase